MTWLSGERRRQSASFSSEYNVLIFISPRLSDTDFLTLTCITRIEIIKIIRIKVERSYSIKSFQIIDQQC